MTIAFIAFGVSWTFLINNSKGDSYAWHWEFLLVVAYMCVQTCTHACMHVHIIFSYILLLVCFIANIHFFIYNSMFILLMISLGQISRNKVIRSNSIGLIKFMLYIEPILSIWFKKYTFQILANVAVVIFVFVFHMFSFQ